MTPPPIWIGPLCAFIFNINIQNVVFIFFNIQQSILTFNIRCQILFLTFNIALQQQHNFSIMGFNNNKKDKHVLDLFNNCQGNVKQIEKHGQYKKKYNGSFNLLICHVFRVFLFISSPGQAPVNICKKLERL